MPDLNGIAIVCRAALRPLHDFFLGRRFHQPIAAQHFFRAAAIEPTDPFINLSIADYEHSHGNLDVALEYYQKALKEAWNADQSTQVLNNMASIYRQKGDAAKADACQTKLQTLPKRAVNWQGAWWEQITPMIM